MCSVPDQTVAMRRNLLYGSKYETPLIIRHKSKAWSITVKAERISDICVGCLSVTYLHTVRFLDTVSITLSSRGCNFSDCLACHHLWSRSFLAAWHRWSSPGFVSTVKTSGDTLDSFSAFGIWCPLWQQKHVSQAFWLKWVHETRAGTTNYFRHQFPKAQADVFKGLSSKIQNPKI